MGRKENDKTYYLRNREKIREKRKKAEKDNPEKYKEFQRKWYLNKGRYLKGLPKPSRNCPEACELCGIVPSGKIKSLCLDHDHVTGEFRGWICSNCNKGLGFFKDNPELIERAADYVRTFGKTVSYKTP